MFLSFLFKSFSKANVLAKWLRLKKAITEAEASSSIPGTHMVLERTISHRLWPLHVYIPSCTQNKQNVIVLIKYWSLFWETPSFLLFCLLVGYLQETLIISWAKAVFSPLPDMLVCQLAAFPSHPHKVGGLQLMLQSKVYIMLYS